MPYEIAQFKRIKKHGVLSLAEKLEMIVEKNYLSKKEDMYHGLHISCFYGILGNGVKSHTHGDRLRRCLTTCSLKFFSWLIHAEGGYPQKINQ